MDLTFWKVKGYNGVQLKKENLQNKDYSFDEIKKDDNNIIKDVEKCLDNAGVVFCLTKKKIIKAVYIFKLTTKAKENVLVFDKKIILDEVSNCVKEFEKDIETPLKEIVYNRHDLEKAVWRDKEFTHKEKFATSISTIKLFAWMGIILCCVISLAMVVSSTLYSLGGITNNSIKEVAGDDALMSYASTLNNYGYFEITETVSGYESVPGFIVVEIVLPTLFRLCGFILLIFSLKEILDLVKNVPNKKTLFTNEKNDLLKRVLLRTFIALFFLSDLLIWIIIGVVLEIIQYLFNYCVCLTNKENK